MNRAIILGTMTRDVELKYTQSGTAIASFGIATNDRWKDASGQQQEKVHFFDVTAFGKQGETINQYLRKGSRILVEGSLDYQTWKAQDGTSRSKVGIKLSGFTFVDKKSDTQPQQGYQQPQHQPQDQAYPLQPQQQGYPQATLNNNVDDPNRHNINPANRPPINQDPAYNQQTQPLPQVDVNSENIPF